MEFGRYSKRVLKKRKQAMEDENFPKRFRLLADRYISKAFFFRYHKKKQVHYTNCRYYRSIELLLSADEILEIGLGLRSAALGHDLLSNIKKFKDVAHGKN